MEELLTLLVDAQRLNKALTTKNDFSILINNKRVIENLEQFESWVKEIYDSREIKEFKKTLKFLKDEADFWKKKGSSKENLVRSHYKSLNNAYFKLLSTFKFLLNEIHQHEENIAYKTLINENVKLRNLLGWTGELNISEDVSRFIYSNRDSFNKITQQAVIDTQKYLEQYKEKNGEYPETIKQLKQFIK